MDQPEIKVPIMNFPLINTNSDVVGSFTEMTEGFLNECTNIWWEDQNSGATFQNEYSHSHQKSNEILLDNMTTSLLKHCNQIPVSEGERKRWKQDFFPGIIETAVEIFNFKSEHIEFIESRGFIDAMEDFCRQARKFDPQITGDDLYQAGRNIVTANLIQVLLGLPVRVTPSLFAYSMLYPYTDNYLDDNSIPHEKRIGFNRRFLDRLKGNAIEISNSHEDSISRLIGMIESEWDRDKYPEIYESLLSIYQAQCLSMRLVSAGLSPYERDVLGISFLKGGTSVMTDGYLAAGTLTKKQARALFRFGAFTQLMDDMEDIRDDANDQRASLFTLTTRSWQLDGLFERFCNFGKLVITNLNAFQGEDVPLISDLMRTCIDPILLNMAAQSQDFFSHGYIRALETHMPVSFTCVNRQRSKLSRHKLNATAIMEVFLL